MESELGRADGGKIVAVHHSAQADASAPVWLVNARVAAFLAVVGHARLPGLAVVVAARVDEAGHRRVALAVVHTAMVAAAVAVLHREYGQGEQVASTTASAVVWIRWWGGPESSGDAGLAYCRQMGMQLKGRPWRHVAHVSLAAGAGRADVLDAAGVDQALHRLGAWAADRGSGGRDQR